MAKKQTPRSRAARRAVDSFEVDANENEPKQETKVRIAEEIALKEIREKGKKPEPAAFDLNDELTAISMGVHPEQKKPAAGSRITKSSRKNKRDKQKKIKAQAFQDMLAEKIVSSKKKHSTVKNYRAEDE